MKKIRTLSQLSDELDKDLSQRKRALTSLRFTFLRATNEYRKVVGLSAVCLLYGHWEGFIKYAGICYANYVNSLGLPYSALSNGMVAVCLRSHIRGLRDSKKISLNREIIEIIRDRSAETPTIPFRAAIETYDNLNAEVLEEILIMIGCSPDPYQSKKAQIDEKLLRHRNRIAHNGDDPEFDLDEYEVLHTNVVTLIDQFRDDLENAAALRKFERTVPMTTTTG
jgi:hypothetical protein